MERTLRSSATHQLRNLEIRGTTVTRASRGDPMGQVAVTTPNRGGRPRDPQVDVRVVEAGRAELAAAPYSRMRMDDVAARAGVAKTTLYRRYPSKLALVRGALSQ